MKVTVGPGQVPPLVGQSASVVAGDLGGHTGQAPSCTWFRLASLAVCVGLHGNTPGGLQAFSGIRYGGSCCKFNELVAHCCLGAGGAASCPATGFLALPGRLPEFLVKRAGALGTEGGECTDPATGGHRGRERAPRLGPQGSHFPG